jgi:hypothetical protein
MFHESLLSISVDVALDFITLLAVSYENMPRLAYTNSLNKMPQSSMIDETDYFFKLKCILPTLLWSRRSRPVNGHFVCHRFI